MCSIRLLRCASVVYSMTELAWRSKPPSCVSVLSMSAFPHIPYFRDAGSINDYIWHTDSVRDFSMASSLSVSIQLVLNPSRAVAAPRVRYVDVICSVLSSHLLFRYKVLGATPMSG